MITDPAALGADLAQEARHQGERRALVLAGAADWCQQGAHRLLRGAAIESPLWIGRDAPAGVVAIAAERAVALLGGEQPALVFDAHAGFDPDAFGQAAGTVSAGGLLLLLVPPLATWADFADPEKRRLAIHPIPPAAVTGHFLARLAQQIGHAPEITLLEQSRLAWCEEPTAASRATPQTLTTPSPSPITLTADQAAAVDAIQHTARGHRQRPLVITADRGRGKSTALGLAAAHLLAEGFSRIAITAPRPAAVEALFRHAAQALPMAQLQPHELTTQSGRLSFIAPDRLATGDEPAALVLVDEAAAIPLALLERILLHYPRVVFASTVHGYEGSGRGFALRFGRLLDRRYPGWHALTLQQPVRWATTDPVEPWVFRLLLLDAEPVAAEQFDLDAPLTIERLDRAALARDEAGLRPLFGLLVLAHYRTRPLDLRHLLDGPNLSLFALRLGPHLAGVALVAEEGGFDSGLAEAVALGQRRPRGHLIPQSLAAHMGLVSAAERRCARISRIAIHPALQGRGLGRQLVTAVGQWAAESGCDLLGASFGADPGVIRFWQRCHLLPVRLGLTRETASGAPSLMVLHPFSAAGHQLLASARHRFTRNLPELLAEPLNDLDPALVLALLATLPALTLTAEEQAECADFAAGRRGYDACLPGLRQGALARLTAPQPPAMAEGVLLVARLLQRHPWGEVAKRYGLAGRAAVEQRLRQVLAEV